MKNKIFGAFALLLVGLMSLGIVSAYGGHMGMQNDYGMEEPDTMYEDGRYSHNDMMYGDDYRTDSYGHDEMMYDNERNVNSMNNDYRENDYGHMMYDNERNNNGHMMWR